MIVTGKIHKPCRMSDKIIISEKKYSYKKVLSNTSKLCQETVGTRKKVHYTSCLNKENMSLYF